MRKKTESKRIENVDKNFAAKTTKDPNALNWIAATDRRLTVRGLPWFKENRGSFSRLPLRAEKIVREPVWMLGQCPASARVCFRSDTTKLSIRVTNADTIFMPHMPMSGSHGCILYVGTGQNIRPWSTAVPDPANPSFERQLLTNITREMRDFTLYLPLYKALKKLEIGVVPGAKLIAPTPLASTDPVVFYGTSITQGGCASTAGSDFVSTVGRLLNIDVVNLGFSGNGKGEPEVAKLVSEVKASLYVLDYATNVTASELESTLPNFVAALRKSHPKTPILLTTNVCFSSYEYNRLVRVALDARRDFTMEYYAQQRRQGDRNIHFVDGFGLLPFGVDGAYVDGVHPTDHGFRLMAERLAPAITRALLPPIWFGVNGVVTHNPARQRLALH